MGEKTFGVLHGVAYHLRDVVEIFEIGHTVAQRRIGPKFFGLNRIRSWREPNLRNLLNDGREFVYDVIKER